MPRSLRSDSVPPDPSATALTVSTIGAMSEVAATAWDGCAGTADPFVSHAFLEALEASGSATAETGWQPLHLLAHNAAGRLVGCTPAYLKAHSYGEYVFDQGWARAYEQAGGTYYPKLLTAVPFTPVAGPRLLVHPAADPALVRSALAAALAEIAQRLGLSSAHVNFADTGDRAALEAEGWLPRLGVQYHWTNPGYRSFDEFLAALSSRKRKMIRRERERAAASGVELLALTGADLTLEHADAFDRCYRMTAAEHWGQAYLTPRFWRLLIERMPDRVLLILGRDASGWVAGAINLIGADTLYGRTWGTSEAYRFLHFEACYYRAQVFAIERGLKRVEAGAQGEHKLLRGYLPSATWSLHRMTLPAFHRAVADFLQRERTAMEEQMQALSELSPFKGEEEGEARDG